jgi:phosphate transport system substrate-binding protein
MRRSTCSRLALSAAAIIGMVFAASSADALKYAKREHNIQADPALPVWVPGPLDIQPEEEFNIVGADVMDQMTLGWAMMMRKAYPRLSVTMEARASGSGGAGLTNGISHAAPVGRELLPAEEEAFVAKFGYKPIAIRVATGSAGSLGKTAASIIMVDRDNPVQCLSLAQLDGIYSKSHLRGGSDITSWGQVGATGVWANRPIHLYGLKHPNGIEWYFQIQVMRGGTYRDDIQFVKGRGFTHAFNVAAEDMATHPGGLTYALLANVLPNTRVLPLSMETGGRCVSPTVQSVYDHTYPLSRFVYVYINKAPGKPIEPKTKEFLRAILSREGQQQVANDGVYLPLQPSVVREELAKLDQI